MGEVQTDSGLRIGAARTTIADDAAALARTRAELARDAAISVVPAWEDGLLERLLRICREAAFVPETIGRIGSRTIEEHDVAGRLIRFLLERPAFLEWAATVTGCEPLRHVDGLIGEMAADTEQRLDWHDDLNDGGFRRLAIIMHLSEAPCAGGTFEIREKASERMLFRQEVQPAGTLTLFRIGPTLHHRVTPVRSGGPRRVFGGWLRV